MRNSRFGPATSDASQLATGYAPLLINPSVQDLSPLIVFDYLATGRYPYDGVEARSEVSQGGDHGFESRMRYQPLAEPRFRCARD